MAIVIALKLHISFGHRTHDTTQVIALLISPCFKLFSRCHITTGAH